MRNWIGFSGLVGVASLAFAPAAFAGLSVAVPSPVLGAGLPGLAVLAAAGAGYLVLRMRRRDRD